MNPLTTSTTSLSSSNNVVLSKLYALCDNYFLLSERNTTIVAEIRAGTASFLTLSYLLLVNPHIMKEAGVSHNDAVIATALSASISCFIMGLFGNLPFGLAPGLGLSAYLTFGLVQTGLCTLPEALTACWWSGILVFVISISGISSLLMHTVPHAIKLAIVVGMGLLIAMIGLVSIDLIVANPKTLVELGNVFGSIDIQLALLGILLVASLLYHNIKGAILIGITALTLITWMINQSWPTTIFDIPVLHLNNEYWTPMVVFDFSRLSIFGPAIGAFVLICIFDISGVMFGLATLGNIIHPTTQEIPGSLWAFIASAVGTVVAAFLGSTPIIVCVECASGVREGGRTGLTAVVIGLYFLLSIFLAPLFSAVPEVATAPVLVMVGVMMMSESAKIPWENMNDALPAFLTIILMPLTYSITNGMIFGLVTSAAFYFTTGQFVSDAKTLHRTLSNASTVSSTSDESGSLLTNADKSDNVDPGTIVKNGSEYGTV